MPTTANRAARWIKSGKCTPFWKRGVFCDAAPHLAHLNGKEILLTPLQKTAVDLREELYNYIKSKK